MSAFTCCVSIDTEEDNWGSFTRDGATTANIGQLPELQDMFDRWGARPTYLVNLPPLLDRVAAPILGRLGEAESVEIGAHCHPWNTPPCTGEGEQRSMMHRLTVEENAAKIREVATRIRRELGTTPRSFRAGRWGFGPTVASGLAGEGFEVDCSVSSFVDWSSIGGPDFSAAPHSPYRFWPEEPTRPAPDGPLVQLPPTIGFVRGSPRRSAALRKRLVNSPLAKLKVVGLLDNAGLLRRRWLSPETSTGDDMCRVLDAWLRADEAFAHLTFHSCTLLPGATPYVRDATDRARFMAAVDKLLRHVVDLGGTFRTLIEAGRDYRDRLASSDPAGQTTVDHGR